MNTQHTPDYAREEQESLQWTRGIANEPKDPPKCLCGFKPINPKLLCPIHDKAEGV